MSDDQGAGHSAPEAEQAECRLRLKRFREAAGKHPGELAEFVGNSISSYYDLENCDTELYMAISLGELSALCSALGIKVRELFAAQDLVEPPISSEQLISKIGSHLNQTGMSVTEFEERIGFEIQPCLEDVSKCNEWSVDFLRWLCHELKLDWRLALP